MNSIAGHCGSCGAPYWGPNMWFGTSGPPVTPSCTCWNMPRTLTSSHFYVDTKTGDNDERQRDGDTTTEGCRIRWPGQ